MPRTSRPYALTWVLLVLGLAAGGVAQDDSGTSGAVGPKPPEIELVGPPVPPPPPPALTERETRSRVDYYWQVEDWVLRSLILLSMEGSWHPAGAEILLEALDGRDLRLRAHPRQCRLPGQHPVV